MAIVTGDVHVFHDITALFDEAGVCIEVSGHVQYVDSSVVTETAFYIGPVNAPAYVLDLQASVADMLDASTPSVS
jgi:hypothetical protein